MEIRRGLIFTLRRELYKLRRLKTFVVVVAFLPLLSLLFLVALFEKGVPRDLPVAVVDYDMTSLSRQAARMIDAGAFVKVVDSPPSVEAASEMMDKGDIDAIVIIPEGLERSILRNERQEVPIFINGSNLLVGSLIQKDIVTTVQTFSTGIEIQKLETQGLSPLAAYSASLPISFSKHVLFNPYTSYGYYLMPGFMAMMIFFFAILSTVFAMGLELKRGTAFKWLSGAGHNMGVAIVGKMLPYTLWFWILSFVMMWLLYAHMGVPMNGSATVIIVASLLLVLAYQWLGVLILSVTKSLRLGLSIAAGYSVLAFSFSGLTFPFIGMDGFVATIGKVLFPFTHYMDIFVDQSMRGAPVSCSMPDIIALCLFVLAGMAAVPLLRRLCVNSKFWGRL